MYVTDMEDHSLFHFRVEEKLRFVARFRGKGSGIGQFNDPRQLAVSTNGDIFVILFKSEQIQILNSNLHYKRHISHHSMVQPIDVKLTPDEVFVLCYYSPCVKVFSYTGRLMRSLITLGGIGMQVNYPTFFCLDTDRNILLSDHTAHQIKIFSKEGTLLHTLGKYGREPGMHTYSQGIALTSNLKLVIVSSNRNYGLQIHSSH